MFSNSSALFCTRRTLNPFVFKQFRTLLQKTPGVGGALRFLPLCFLAPPRISQSSPILALAGACELDLSRSYREDPDSAGAAWTSLPTLPFDFQLPTVNLLCAPPRVTEHGPRVTSLATLFHPWHANASANTFSPISTGARRSRAPFAFRRIPWRHSLATIEVSEPRSRRTINIAGSKLAQGTVK